MTAGGGTVNVLEYPSADAMTHANVSTTSLTQAPRAWATDMRRHGAFISRANTNTAYEFTNLASSGSQSDCRTVCALVVSGPASTKAVMFEYVVNYEFQVEANTIYGRMSKQVLYSPLQERLNAAADSVESAISGYTEGEISSISTKIKRIAKSVLLQTARAGVVTAANYFLPGVGGAAASYAIMDVN